MPESICSRMGNVVQDIPEVIEYHRVTGGDSGIMKIVVSSVAHLEVVIDRSASLRHDYHLHRPI